MNFTWESIEMPDYIEKAHSIISADVFKNLELTQSNSKDAFLIVKSWCEFQADVFHNRDRNLTLNAKLLEAKQS